MASCDDGKRKRQLYCSSNDDEDQIKTGKKPSLQAPRPKVTIQPRGIGPIFEPNENDVLCGRGGLINSRSGNVAFRDIISTKKNMYLSPTTKNADKAHIAASVVAAIRQMNPPGRFLKKDSDGFWYDIGDGRAISKCQQGLREKASEICAREFAQFISDCEDAMPPPPSQTQMQDQEQRPKSVQEKLSTREPMIQPGLTTSMMADTAVVSNGVSSHLSAQKQEPNSKPSVETIFGRSFAPIIKTPLAKKQACVFGKDFTPVIDSPFTPRPTNSNVSTKKPVFTSTNGKSERWKAVLSNALDDGTSMMLQHNEVSLGSNDDTCSSFKSLSLDIGDIKSCYKDEDKQQILGNIGLTSPLLTPRPTVSDNFTVKSVLSSSDNSDRKESKFLSLLDVDNTKMIQKIDDMFDLLKAPCLDDMDTDDKSTFSFQKDDVNRKSLHAINLSQPKDSLDSLQRRAATSVPSNNSSTFFYL